MRLGKNSFLLGLFIFLTILILAEFLILFVNSKSINNLHQKKFITVRREQISLGISEPRSETTFKSLTITGLLKKYYKKDSRHYIELQLPIKDKIYSLIVDLSTDNYFVTTHQARVADPKVDKDFPTSLRNAEGIQRWIKWTIVRTNTKELTPSIENNINKVIQIEIILTSEIGNRTCNDTCKTRLAELDKYKENNNQLLSSTKGFKNNLTVGVPMNIDFSQ